MNSKILLVDDEPNVLAAYVRNLRGKFQVATALSGADGLEILEAKGPFAVVVSDYRMPEMDGIQFLAQAKLHSPDTVRIMLTGQADLAVSIDAINEGNIFRFLNKPCPTEQLIVVLASAVEQYRLNTSERELLEKTLKGSIKLLLDILTVVSPDSFSQASRLRTLAHGIATRLKLTNAWEVELGAMLSQVGCFTIPAEVLNKKHRDEPLSETEVEMFYTHAQTGKNLLVNIPRLESVAEGVGSQFKQYDGHGLPLDGKKGLEIPVIGRILKVILDFDALTAKGMPAAQAVVALRRKEGHYDPDILAALDAEALQVANGFVVKAVAAEELVNGMVLADDIKDNTGAMLLPKGQELTEVLRMRLLVFSRLGRVIEPVRVLQPLDTEKKPD